MSWLATPWSTALAVAADGVGGLDRVRIVQMLVFVASTPEFGQQSKVADAASDLLVDVLGENGRHARTAIGVAGLPRNTPVELQMVCSVPKKKKKKKKKKRGLSPLVL